MAEAMTPLSGLRIIEFAGIGPGPFAAMMLGDMGADVIRVERPDAPYHPNDFTLRGRRSIAVNLKAEGAVDTVLRLIENADGVIEGFRPGVMERLGLGPTECLARHPKLVYGRMTGWGQEGPLAHAAGHDLNYIALTGALWATGEADRAPTFPMNLLGDFGGGGMYLVAGMLAGLLQAQRTGKGDVIDAAITDGTNNLMTFIQARRAEGRWTDQRAANALDGGAPWYSVYECADGAWITIAALEPKFWDCLINKLGLEELADRTDPRRWPQMRTTLARTFLSKPRAEWDALLEGTDACYAPVLSPAEAAAHPHMAARAAFSPIVPDQPAPAPRFGRSPAVQASQPCAPGADSRSVLSAAGYSATEIDRLIATGVVSVSALKEAAE